MEQYQRSVSEWEAERRQLIQREQEARERMEQVAQERKAAKAAA